MDGPFKLDVGRALTGPLPPIEPASPAAWLQHRIPPGRVRPAPSGPPGQSSGDPLAVFSELGDSLGRGGGADNLLSVRYYVLAAYLRERAEQPCVLLRVEDIEAILGGPLPPAAHVVDLFWSNRAAYAAAWRSAGFRTRRRGLPRGIVAFIHDTVPGEDAPELDVLRHAAEAAWLAGGAWVALRLPDLLPGEGERPWSERATGGSEGTRDKDRQDTVAARRDRPRKGAGRGLAPRLTQEFCDGRMGRPVEKPSGRHESPPASGWKALPEVVVASLLRDAGATDVEVRLFLTFGAAMNRGQDPDRLWLSALELFRLVPWAFDPCQAAGADSRHLAAGLARTRLSLSPAEDAVAWQAIAASLAVPDTAPETSGDTAATTAKAVRDVVFAGTGDALDLLAALDLLDPATGARRFPALCAPRNGSRWIRMLAHPGGAALSSLQYLPLAVDASVRRATECLGVTSTRGLALSEARPCIQETWQDDVLRHGTAAPPGLEGTNAALEPALTFLGLWGCAACERAGRRTPISDVCAECRF